MSLFLSFVRPADVIRRYEPSHAIYNTSIQAASVWNRGWPRPQSVEYLGWQATNWALERSQR